MLLQCSCQRCLWLGVTEDYRALIDFEDVNVIVNTTDIDEGKTMNSIQQFPGDQVRVDLLRAWRLLGVNSYPRVLFLYPWQRILITDDGYTCGAAPNYRTVIIYVRKTSENIVYPIRGGC